ncbi:short chain dehydrogenase [Flagellimonas sp. HMM57]|uniref:short chain dehydrogenase n=1 Tax=unclassified Flagellimonas TaxID=2644544 RepID=UPI0013D8306B|nr:MULTISPECIES: short chain dehydrogenase [unclassified Flagellimonas]UII75772.1 short chain dehydrogenase [Flagellimonas sp. HMM57]
MKIVIIGGKGTIGNKVTDHFSRNNEVLVAGRTSGSVTVDIANPESIKKMFDAIGMVDAIICIAGEAKWAPFNDLTEDDYYIGIKSKLMGQVNLIRIGQHFLNSGGSITLSTGVLADDPVVKTASAAMVNGGIHSFAQAAALELEQGHRLNVVSLELVIDAYEKYKDYFMGHTPISMEKAVNAYVRSVLGKKNGEIIRVYT